MLSSEANRTQDSDGHWEWSLAPSRLHVSARWAALVGAGEHEVGTTPDAWLTRIHPDDRDRISTSLNAHIAMGGPHEFDLPHRLRHADGSYRWMSCRGTVQRDASGKAVRLVGAHADVTADTVMEPVTGLPNRLLLLDHLSRSIERAKRYPGFHFALLIIDLDRAESFSAAAPRIDDPLLVAAARRLETSLRIGYAAADFRHDDIVARLEGDRFAILVDGLKEVGDATVVAERVLTTLLKPFTTRDHEGYLSPSIGVAVSATGYDTADAALRDAETALHRAKLLGKARFEVFDTAALKIAQTKLRLEADFAGALERREFQVFYQPIVALDGHAIVGFEALARWQHPVLGMVSPLDFIPVAEQTGFILPLGLWILREACQQLKAWQQQPSVPSDLWVSVNVSGLQFRHEPLFAEIKQVLADTGLDPRHLVLELTEALAIDQPAAVKAVLMQLRSLGIRVSVDDFGTGYSSLTRLHQFPFDCLKVDRAFVRGMEGSTEMSAILGSITTMARELGLQVVIEGIESGAQLALLQSVHCQYLQGYVFSKPLDAARASALLERGTSVAPATDTSSSIADAPLIAAVEPRGWWRTPKYLAAAAVLSIAVATALVVVPNVADEDSVGNGAVSAPPAASVTTSAGPGSASAEAAAAAVAVPMPAARREVGTAKSAVKDSAPRTVTAPLEAAAPLKATGPPVMGVANAVATARVVHQHRLGGCRGVLKASAQGLAFEPDEPASKDGFTFAYREFVHRLDGATLILKTNDRTYRFEPISTNGKQQSGELSALLATLNASH